MSESKSLDLKPLNAAILHLVEQASDPMKTAIAGYELQVASLEETVATLVSANAARVSENARLEERIKLLERERHGPPISDVKALPDFKLGEAVVEEEPELPEVWTRYDNGVEWEYRQRVSGDDWALYVHSAWMREDLRRPGHYLVQATGKVMGNIVGYGHQRDFELEVDLPNQRKGLNGSAKKKTLPLRSYHAKLNGNTHWMTDRVVDGPDFMVFGIMDPAAARNWA